MKPSTEQEKFWSSEFGKEYNERNYMNAEETDKYYTEEYGITKTDMNKPFLNNIPLKRVLEAGCNVGVQLNHLQKTTTIKEFFGIDIQHDAILKARTNVPFANTIQGSIFDIPFKDEFFDMVFTTGVLIHIAPEDLIKAMKEIVRCSKKFVWGFEYFSDKCQKIDYRGHDGFLWKNDFAGLYRENFPELKLVMEKKFKYKNNGNIDSMFLFEKK